MWGGLTSRLMYLQGPKLRNPESACLTFLLPQRILEDGEHEDTSAQVKDITAHLRVASQP